MEFYKCGHRGNVVALLQRMNIGGAPSVSGVEPMMTLSENTTDAAVEKHVPVISREGQKVTVHVGSVDHPMQDVHYIEWIAIETSEGVQIKFLQPNKSPEAVFYTDTEITAVKAYAYCNLHGLWSAKA